VIAITVIGTNSANTWVMDRITEETDYVLTILQRMREEVNANPQLFDPDALERIDEAIACMEGARQHVKAA
jgi:hypothetical protein